MKQEASTSHEDEHLASRPAAVVGEARDRADAGRERVDLRRQMQVIDCGSHSHDAQSASLKQDSPPPKGPGVHDDPLELALVLDELLDPHMGLPPIDPMLTHSAEHDATRHAFVETETEEAAPQPSAPVQAATVPPS
jgi:hypothetical protein